MPLSLLNRPPRWLSGKQSAANPGDVGDVSSIPRFEDPLEEEVATLPVSWKNP